jgi:hypothetical protein
MPTVSKRRSQRQNGKETFRTNFSLRFARGDVRYDFPTYKNIHDLRNDKNLKQAGCSE